MKKLLFSLALMLFAGFTFGQVKVHTNGGVGVGAGFTDGTYSVTSEALDVDGDLNVYGSNLFVGENTANAGAYIECGKNRTANGFAGLRFYTDATATSSGFNFVRTTGGNANFTQSGDRAISFNCLDAGAAVQFRTLNTTRLIVEDGGDVGIGINNPTEKLHVAGNILYTGSLIPSDKNLKDNVDDYTPGLNAIMGLRTISYKYNGLGGVKSKDLHVGIFAQDLQKVAPELVKETEYVEMEEVSDGEGGFEMKETGKVETYLQIKDNQIKYLLINAIQEQQAQIADKEERIDELENKIDQLETLVNDFVALAQDQNITTITFEGEAGLDQNSPNPFNEQTTINYSVPAKAANAYMQIYDMNGRLLKNVRLENGAGQLIINAGELGANTYTYSLVIDGQVVDTKKMVLTK